MTRPAPLEAILSTLRGAVHAVLAALLVVAVLSFLAENPAGGRTALGLGLAGVLGAAYFLGVLAAPLGPPRWAGIAWLAALVALWAALVVVSDSFVWLLFPLVFVVLSQLPPAAGAAALAAMWALAALVPYRDNGVAGVVGPAFGVLVAAGAYWGYRALSAEAQRFRRLAEELREARGRLLEAENAAGRLAERQRLSAEIHDTLAQGFNSIVLLSRAARGQLAGIDAPGEQAEKLRSHVAAIEDTASENLAEARRLVAGRAAPARPLSEALRELAAKTRRRERDLGRDVLIELDAPEVGALPDPVAAALYRIAAEALANALRHGEPSRVRLTLNHFGDEVALDVFDDGRGFDPDAVETTAEHGFGIAGMRRRAAAAGGELTVDSEPGATVVAATIPLR